MLFLLTLLLCGLTVLWRQFYETQESERVALNIRLTEPQYSIHCLAADFSNFYLAEVDFFRPLESL